MCVCLFICLSVPKKLFNHFNWRLLVDEHIPKFAKVGNPFFLEGMEKILSLELIFFFGIFGIFTQFVPSPALLGGDSDLMMMMMGKNYLSGKLRNPFFCHVKSI